MAIRRLNNKYTLPPNSVYVEFPRSDGDSSLWPTETERKVDRQGQVNYFRPVEVDESLSIHWRKVVGPIVAEILGLPAGKPYVLKSLPSGYQLYDHNKGKADNPRHDPYLYGSTRIGKQRFRSVNEFVPHAVWLASNNPTAVCLCKYCSGKKTQTEISVSFGLSTKRASVAGSVASTPPPRSQRRPAPYPPPQPKPPHAAVRRAPKPVKPPHVGTLPPPKQILALEKSNDIHNALTSRSVQEIRYFRRGELVWCALDPPIRGSLDEEDAILFWPGLVDVVTTKATPVPRADAENDDEAVSDSSSQGEAPKARVTWSVKQQTLYKVKLLATAHSYLLSDAEMLPYLSYAPSTMLLASLRDALPEALRSDASQELAHNPGKMALFNPQDVSLLGSDRYKEAVTPYTLAIQIASHIATYWSPTDEWECKFSLPPPSPLPQTSNAHVPSLQDVLNSTMEHNSELLSQPPAEQPPPVSTPAPTRSSERVAAATQNVTQLRYQGLWWGAERIWTDELVRLKLARCQFAPQGAQAVYPPAGPSKSAQEWDAEHGIPNDEALSGAGEKGMFMRIEGLFVVDVPKPNGEGTIKECRASGMLYELVDEDWVDPEESTQNGIAVSNGQPVPDEATESASSGPIPLQASSEVQPLAESASAPAPPRKDQSLLNNLSRPVLTTPFPLPDPPEGHKFHAILPHGNECVLSLSLISGRYYPRLFRHPLLKPIVDKALEVPLDQGGLFINKHLWSMEGLLPGVHQSMDPEQWKDTRNAMFKDADAEARQLLLQEITQHERERQKAEQELQEQTTPMSISAGLVPSEVQEDASKDVIMNDAPPLAGPSSISAAV